MRANGILIHLSQSCLYVSTRGRALGLWRVCLLHAGQGKCCCWPKFIHTCARWKQKCLLSQQLHTTENSAACLQAQFQAIETRARQAQETLTQQEAEAVKLEQRLAAAREQYDSGLSKLRSTARQLESLASQARRPPVCCGGLEAGHEGKHNPGALLRYYKQSC